jgi:hypothetical protein
MLISTIFNSERKCVRGREIKMVLVNAIREYSLFEFKLGLAGQ